jgi:hypothetical protein
VPRMARKAYITGNDTANIGAPGKIRTAEPLVGNWAHPVISGFLIFTPAMV